MHLGHLIERNARIYPDKTAFVQGERRTTFREHAERVYRLINALERWGIGSGERVAVLAKNRPEYLEVYGAAECGGRIVVPLNFRLATRELQYIIRDASASVLVVEGAYLETIEQIRDELPDVKHYIALESASDRHAGSWVDYAGLLDSSDTAAPRIDIDPGSVAYLMYTSGTTGLPKGVMLTHHGNLENAKSLMIELRLRPDDIHLAVMPLFHVGGRGFPLLHFYRGCTTVLMRDFEPSELSRRTSRRVMMLYMDTRCQAHRWSSSTCGCGPSGLPTNHASKARPQLDGIRAMPSRDIGKPTSMAVS